jgi:hypothetical protein
MRGPAELPDVVSYPRVSARIAKNKTLKRKTPKKDDIILSRARDRPARAAGAPSSPNRLAPWTTANPTSPFFFLANCRARDAARPAATPTDHPNYGLRCFDITPIHATIHLPVSSCELQNWQFLLYIKQLQLTDCSFEPPWASCSGNPLAAIGRLHRTMGPG